MAPKEEEYQQVRIKNLDGYFKALEVPYIPRKMMLLSNPTLQIKQEGDKWTMKTISLIRTVEMTFSLGEEFEERVTPGVTLKNVAKIEGDCIVISSTGPNGEKTERKYEFTDDEVILTMIHEQTGQIAKRYFKRIS